MKPAILLLLMMRLDRPTGARELADILGLDEHTVAKYLRILTKLDLVVRTQYRGGYRLVPGCQDLLGTDLTVRKLQFEPASSTVKIPEYISKEDQITAVVDQPSQEGADSTPADPETIRALQCLGIGEPKRSMLANLDHINPSYIRAWHAHLSYSKGDRYGPGLLIHVLETGDPAPEVRENGHPLDCSCRECCPLICPECHVYPCDCED